MIDPDHFVIAAGLESKEYTTIFHTIPMPFNAYSRDLCMRLLGFWTRLLTITGSDYAVDGLRGIFTPSPTMDRVIFVLSYLRYQINRRVVNAAWPSPVFYAP